MVASSAAVATVQTANHRVIVVFKNQEKSLPPTRALESRRASAIHGIQAPVTSQLSASGAKQVQSYNVINAVSATVSSSEESQLKSNPAVSEVIPDQVIQLASPQQASSRMLNTGAKVTPLPGTCSTNPADPQLEPQALQLLHADSNNPNAHTARSLGIDGAGVKVAFIADGLDTNNPDFIRQPSGTPVFSDYKDFTGFGTGQQTGGEEAFGDASSIAAQGNQVYDISNYSSLPLNKKCYIRIEGVAPGASLVGLEAFTADEGFNSAILQAIQYAVTDGVNVLSESFGSNNTPDDGPSLDLIKQADDMATAAGVVVTVSTGDAGVTSTIGSPATDTNLISAGATTSYQIDAQDGYGGARFPGVTGFLNNNISSFSSGGFDSAGGTVDVVAPGELGWALCSTDTAMYGNCVSLAGNPTPFLAFGGTSESAPLTAGVAALVIQAYEKTHSGTPPTPAVVKQIITSTAHDIGAPADQQGSGLVNAYKAVLAAESYSDDADREHAARELEPAERNGPDQHARVADRHDHQQRREYPDNQPLDPDARRLPDAQERDRNAQRQGQLALDRLAGGQGQRRNGHVQRPGRTEPAECRDRVPELCGVRHKSERTCTADAGRPQRQPRGLLGAAGRRQLRRPPGHRSSCRQVDRVHLQPRLGRRWHHRTGCVLGQLGDVHVVRQRHAFERDARSGRIADGHAECLDAIDAG